MTSISALDGTVVVLAASGAFHDLGTAVTIGLTVIAGGGAWAVANETFGGTRFDRARVRSLLGIALVSTVLTVFAVVLGTWLGNGPPLRWLPKAGGLSLLVVAAQTAGLPLRGIGGGLVTTALVVAGTLAEVWDHWSS